MFNIDNINKFYFKIVRNFASQNQIIMNTTKVTIAKGDGIGPEIMNAVLKILEAAGARIETEEIQIGEKVYLSGNTSGISENDWKTIRENKIFLKAPITTPQGGGYKSLNVSIRKSLGLFANVRPCSGLHHFVQSRHPEMDVVIVRENEEDLYAGIEHQQTDEVVQCLKLISRPGCEKIIRYAFEYAVQQNRSKVTCFTKDNIMKQTDGLFHRVFREIAAEYPDIKNEHYIVDIGTALLADNPERFDVIVTPNLYGDIISDVAAQIAGSVGLAGSANIGEECSMFEAIHGSAPDIAGKNIANPSGLLQGAIMMLNHIGDIATSTKIQNAWLKTIEDGIHTSDIFTKGQSKQLVGTKEFADAVINNLGKMPGKLIPKKISQYTAIKIPPYVRKPALPKDLKGVDIFIHWNGTNPDELAAKLKNIESGNMQLQMITNRGIKVWPKGLKETFCTDHWRCRFIHKDYQNISQKEIIALISSAEQNRIDTIKTENLFYFDGQPAFSLAQGQ
jgi:isocitrate dehydrogenase